MDLLQSLLNVVYSLAEFLLAIGKTLLPWSPLFAWIAFWLLAVDWVSLWPTLFKRGGWIGVALILVMAVLIWSVVAPPPDGVHHVLGLKVSNMTGKLVYVTALTFIAFMCGTAQLSGACKGLIKFDPPVLAEAHAHHGDDHGHGGDHGHDAHAGSHLVVHGGGHH